MINRKVCRMSAVNPFPYILLLLIFNLGKVTSRRDDFANVYSLPTKPDVSRLSSDSVLVRWDVAKCNASECLPIQFFKVQYQHVKSQWWKTVDEEISPHIRSYPLTGLKGNETYKCRIAAVYSNNDNRNSKKTKFTLTHLPLKEKPKFVPFVTSVSAISQSAIELTWTYPYDDLDVTGFTINIRETSSAGPYSLYTVQGGNTRSHIITHLLPGTVYEMKVNAFNSGGISDFSEVVTNRTLVSQVMTTTTTESTPKVLIPIKNCRENDMSVYIIIAVTGTVILLVLVVSLSICVIRNLQNKNVQPSSLSVKKSPSNLGKERHPKAHSLHNLSHFDYTNHYDAYKKPMNGHLARSVLDGLPSRSSPNQAFMHTYQDSGVETDKSEFSIRLNPLSNDICVDIEGRSRTLTSTTFVGSSHANRDVRRSHHNLQHSASDSTSQGNNDSPTTTSQASSSTYDRRRMDEPHPNAVIRVNHRSTSFTRLNGTLERKKRIRTDMISYIDPPLAPTSIRPPSRDHSVMSNRCGSETSSSANGHAMMMQSSC